MTMTTDEDFAARLRQLESESEYANKTALWYANKYSYLVNDHKVLTKRLNAILAELDAKGIELDSTTFLADVPITR